MHGAHEFLKALTLVLCVAGLTTFIFQRLRQPVVLGYLIAGLIIGPYVPIPLVAEPAVVHALSELGVILLMFSLGLEFSLRKLFKIGGTAGLTAIVQSTLMIILGFAVGRAFGWTTLECLFTGAIIAISSTTIIAKAFEEQGVSGKLRQLVVGVLIAEDLIAILLMATLTAVSTGQGHSLADLAFTVGRLIGFLVLLLGVGMLIIPRMVRAAVALGRPETTLVFSIGICFAAAFLAHEANYSVALGAFLAGSLVAESGHEKAIEDLIRPVRDMFAAIFFVSVGMLIDPQLVVEYWLPIVVLIVVVIGGKIVGVAIGAFFTGNGVKTSVKAGMSLAQIGEFSFIIATLGISLKAIGEFLYPIAVAVSAATTLSTPWLIRASESFASKLDRLLPRSIQTFAALYGSWLERLPTSNRSATAARPLRRLILALLVDVGLLASLLIAAVMVAPSVEREMSTRWGTSHAMATAVMVGLTGLIASPFAIGIVGVTRRLGVLIGSLALPENVAGDLDLATAPRRSLVITIQLGIFVLVGVPFVALTQLFLPSYWAFLALAAVGSLLALSFWRSAENLHGHARAGATMIIEALAAQSKDTEHGEKHSLTEVNQILKGLGEPTPWVLLKGSPVIGKTLAEANVRGLSGAMVLAIGRGQDGVHLPSAGETLREGDVLVLAGTQEAVELAKQILAEKAG